MSYMTGEYLPESELENGRVYEIRSRNLQHGVWVAEKHGFIGIRLKFDDRYLFMEYHFDHDPHVGTVRPTRPTDVTIPEHIPLKEHLGTVCQECRKPVEDMGPGTAGAGPLAGKQVKCMGWRHINPEDRTCPRDETYCAMAAGNPELFEILDKLCIHTEWCCKAHDYHADPHTCTLRKDPWFQ